MSHFQATDGNDNDNNNYITADEYEKVNGDCRQSLHRAANGQSTETSKSTTTSQTDEDPRTLIPKLCNHFYHLGWASGTGGGLSIRQNGRIYCAPSGVQKERIQPEDMFVLDERDGSILERPKNDGLKCSECLSLFLVAFKLRNAACCIHSHSINANLITALHSKEYVDMDPDQRYLRIATREFRIKNQEMIKGIKVGSTSRNLNYNDTLIVPIIDNVLFERDLAGAMERAVREYPEANAVLVRNHGVYVWGNSWQQAKSMAECYDYLFKLKLEAVRLGFDWIGQ